MAKQNCKFLSMGPLFRILDFLWLVGIAMWVVDNETAEVVNYVEVRERVTEVCLARTFLIL